MKTLLIDWIEIEVKAPPPFRELVASVLWDYPSTAVEFVEEGVRTCVDAVRVDRSLPQLEDELRGSLLAAGQRVGQTGPDAFTVTCRKLPRVDWELVWREGLKAFRVGRVCIVPEDFDGPLRSSDLRLELMPGDSFGTGRHASTRLALRGLQWGIGPDDRVLDLGCGSGILAVAAALCGAREVLGVDIDPCATRTSQALADANGVADRCAFRDGSVADAAAESPSLYDGVVANLYHDLVQRHAVDVANFLKPGGWFVFAGLRSSERAATERAVAAAGLDVHAVHGGRKWIGFRGTKRET